MIFIRTDYATDDPARWQDTCQKLRPDEKIDIAQTSSVQPEQCVRLRVTNP